MPAELEQLRRGAAERELELLRQQEVPVQRVVLVDAHAAVQVLRGVHDPLAALGRPELRHRDLGRGGQTLGQPPDRLPRGEPDRLGVDVRVGRALTDRLERRDRHGRTARASWCTRPSCAGLPRTRRSAIAHSAAVARSTIQSRFAWPSATSAEHVGVGDPHALEREPRLGVEVGGVLALEDARRRPRRRRARGRSPPSAVAPARGRVGHHARGHAVLHAVEHPAVAVAASRWCAVRAGRRRTRRAQR